VLPRVPLHEHQCIGWNCHGPTIEVKRFPFAESHPVFACLLWTDFLPRLVLMPRGEFIWSKFQHTHSPWCIMRGELDTGLVHQPPPPHQARVCIPLSPDSKLLSVVFNLLFVFVSSSLMASWRVINLPYIAVYSFRFLPLSNGYFSKQIFVSPSSSTIFILCCLNRVASLLCYTISCFLPSS
jgi:hypothetical protein